MCAHDVAGLACLAVLAPRVHHRAAVAALRRKLSRNINANASSDRRVKGRDKRDGGEGYLVLLPDVPVGVGVGLREIQALQSQQPTQPSDHTKAREKRRVQQQQQATTDRNRHKRQSAAAGEDMKEGCAAHG